MSIWGSIALGLGLAFALGWIGRWTAQKMSKSAPRFRDMALVVAFGYVLALELLLGGIWLYFQAPVSDAGVPRASVMFWRWAVHFVVFCAVASVIFRLIGRRIGSPATRKLFRQMPLTAAFGILTILIYAILAIFAGLIAPHGQEEVFALANIVPGGDPALGGNPDFPLGTDQIGRDILSRLIYGAQNTVGIAFATTLLAFTIGAVLGFWRRYCEVGSIR